MNPKELRLGSLIDFDFAGIKPVQSIFQNEVEGDMETTITFYDKDEGKEANSGLTVKCSLNTVKPIPLTEKWLLNFGFKYRNEERGDGCIMDLENDQWKYRISMGKAWQGKGWAYMGAPSSQDMKYVHQLQNLYFALTSKELTYTED